MANTYLKTSFSIEAEAVELDRLTALVALADSVAEGSAGADEAVIVDVVAEAFPWLVESTELRANLEEIIGAPLDGPLCITLNRQTPTLLDLMGEHSPDLDALCGCIRATCASALPIGFTFAVTSDRPEAGAFNGGYMIVSEHGVEGMNAATRMQEDLQAMRREAPLSSVQQAAIDAYDRDGDLATIRNGAGQERTIKLLRDGEYSDTLALFVLIECSDAGDDPQEAARMMEGAAEQLSDVAIALRNHDSGEDQ